MGERKEETENPALPRGQQLKLQQPPYLSPSSSGTAYDIAFLVHDLNPSNGVHTPRSKNIHSTDLCCRCKEKNMTPKEEF